MKKILFIGLFMAAFTSIQAQTTGTSNQTVSLTLKNAISLNIIAATGTTLTFDVPDDYANGIANASASTFQVKSNRPWSVSVKAAAATFSGPPAPAAAMPSNVLSVRLSTGTTYTPLTTSVVSLTSGARGDMNFSVDYRANPGFIYDAGTYTLSVVYTATQL
jgi:hypothetical protein